MFLKCEHVSLWITKSIALDISNILLLFSPTMKPQKQHNHCGEETCVIVNVNQCQSQQNNLDIYHWINCKMFDSSEKYVTEKSIRNQCFLC